ncbi:MAG TPA: hypothetical protein VK486_05040, partial [Thermoleophilaceae bacterium]|nr:hypothetical protein [Thermoleophilaceae bacterium]
FSTARCALIVAVLAVVLMSGVLLQSAIQLEASNPQVVAASAAVLQDLEADDKLLDAQVAAGKMPKRLARRLHLINAETRAKVTNRLLEQRFRKAVDTIR